MTQDFLATIRHANWIAETIQRVDGLSHQDKQTLITSEKNRLINRILFLN